MSIETFDIGGDTGSPANLSYHVPGARITPRPTQIQVLLFWFRGFLSVRDLVMQQRDPLGGFTVLCSSRSRLNISFEVLRWANSVK
jgi:hypothetical protein